MEFNRVMDRAWMRDGNVIHTGEALMLACLLHAKGRTRRGQEEVEHVARIMDDPNLRRKRGRSNRRPVQK
jgi:hypothetical protein